MAPTLVDHFEVGFADGGSGHVVTLTGGATAAVNDVDVIFVISDTLVTTPSGFTLPSNGSTITQGAAYAFYRTCSGGESASVTISTSGSHPTAVQFQRWRGVSTFDKAAKVAVDNSGATSTPSLSTGTLAASGELVIFGAVLHNASSAGVAPTSPVWTGWSGSTAIGSTSYVSGSAGTESASFTAWKVAPTTAAESPTVSWTNSYRDRYAIVVAFQVAAGSTVTFAGATAGGATAGATIARNRGGAATAAGTATATATPSRRRSLAASCAGTATGSATVARRRGASGSSSGIASSAATGMRLVYSASASSSGTATSAATALRRLRRLAGAAAGTGHATASFATALTVITRRPFIGRTVRPTYHP